MSFLTINTTSSGFVHVTTGRPSPPTLAHALYELDGVWNCKNNSLAFVTNAFAVASLEIALTVTTCAILSLYAPAINCFVALYSSIYAPLYSELDRFSINVSKSPHDVNAFLSCCL